MLAKYIQYYITYNIIFYMPASYLLEEESYDQYSVLS